MNLDSLAELGIFIREAREKSGSSLTDVATRIKVSPRILMAIEEGSKDGLPHAVYTRGFVRSYALAVGIKPEDLHPMLDAVFTEEILGNINPELATTAREQAMKPRNTAAAALLAGLLVILLAGLTFGGWFVYDNYGTEILEFVKKPFSASSEPQTDAVPNGKTTALPGEGQPDGKAAAGHNGALTAPNATPESSGVAGLAGNAPAPAATSAQTSGQNTAQVAPTTPAGTTTNSTSGQTAVSGTASSTTESTVSAKNNLAIQAQEECWVEYNSDGAKGRRFTLAPGESVVLPFEKTLQITLGNANGVKLRYNGADYNASGKRVSLTFPPAR